MHSNDISKDFEKWNNFKKLEHAEAEIYPIGCYHNDTTIVFTVDIGVMKPFSGLPHCTGYLLKGKQPSESLRIIQEKKLDFIEFSYDEQFTHRMTGIVTLH
jgi:hypothetical protein